MTQREGIGTGMAAEGIGDIAGCGEISNGNKYRETRNGGGTGDSAKHARSAADAISAHGHGGAQQQRERRVARHGIVFLGRRESEKDQKKAGPTKGQEACLSGAIDWLVGKLGDRRKINAPWKQPEEVEQPEPVSRNCIIVARIAQV